MATWLWVVLLAFLLSSGGIQAEGTPRSEESKCRYDLTSVLLYHACNWMLMVYRGHPHNHAAMHYSMLLIRFLQAGSVEHVVSAAT